MSMLATAAVRVVSVPYLSFARIPLMAGHTNLVEQAVQLADDGGDLLGEVARVHGDCRPASGFVKYACTWRTIKDVVGSLQAALSSPSRSAVGKWWM
jgi:hypothetical protein